MYHRRFDPFVMNMLGQEESSSWRARARTAVGRYDALLARAAALPLDQRAKILDQAGDGTIPGTPSDRYRFVRDLVTSDGPWDDIHQGFVRDLEDADTVLEAEVSSSERSSGGAALTNPDGGLNGLGWGILGVSAVGLFVVPFLLD